MVVMTFNLGQFSCLYQHLVVNLHSADLYHCFYKEMAFCTNCAFEYDVHFYHDYIQSQLLNVKYLEYCQKLSELTMISVHYYFFLVKRLFRIFKGLHPNL